MRNRGAGGEPGGQFLKGTANFGENGYEVTAGLTLQVIDDVTTVIAAVLCLERMSAVITMTMTMTETRGVLALRLRQHVSHQLKVEDPG